MSDTLNKIMIAVGLVPILIAVSCTRGKDVEIIGHKFRYKTQSEGRMVGTITTDPPGATVYIISLENEPLSAPFGNKAVGVTPFDIEIRYSTTAQKIRFVLSAPPTGECSTELIHSGDYNCANIGFFLSKEGFYSSVFNTNIYCEDKHRRYVSEDEARYFQLYDGKRFTFEKCPVSLVPNGQEFREEFTTAIEHGDYYRAEELRLRRIDLIETEIQNARRAVILRSAYAPEKVALDLMKSELFQLNKTVGLLDPQLMAIRKLLVQRLNEGDVDAALGLAQTIATMEQAYFPSEVAAEQGNSQAIVVIPDDGVQRQELTIRQKPYYSVTDIVKSIAAMRGNKVSSQDLQKAQGAASLLDILGYGNMIPGNK